MEIKTILSSFETNGNIFVKGYLFHNGEYVEQKEIISHIEQSVNKEKFFEQLDGSFSIVITYPDKVDCYVSFDQFNSVYFQRKNDLLIISDRISVFRECEKDKQSTEELKSFGFVLGSKTLYNEVFHACGGYHTVIDKEGVKKKKIFTYAIKKQQLLSSSFQVLKAECKSVFERVFDKMITSLNGRTAIVPLSGGYDSRLILAALIKNKYPNIITFTYGKPDCADVKIAKIIAKALGVEWHYIEYSDGCFESELWKKNVLTYVKQNFNGIASVHLHEVYAISHLKEKRLIPEDSVIIPGHSGDFLGGSQFIKVIPRRIKRKNIAKYYIENKSNLTKLKSQIKRKAISEFEKKVRQSDKDCLPYSIFEDIDCEEKLTKFTLGSSHVFDFLDYSVRFPFWDKLMLDFFKKLPIELKLNKLLYDSVCEEYFFKPLGIVFEKELNPTLFDYQLYSVKELIKKILPCFIRRKLILKNDTVNYLAITKPLVEHMQKNTKQFKYPCTELNAIAARYIADFL
ncbi:asparagine synthase C-terminal domain-containing protein [Carboxylicivirga marina]|uniref:asparagine synthase (glutamine-hydrolyzing) n=1 Tax=Carboxylicivirga marina TaxID=2800988 RepID=A0ABS1HLX2_9BACT|nr:asparagine synthase C-terminal domain-containing protein [Carboxylicivirga marina]MBK3518679.1 7-cyano-7-deazaguanine synthase [Carboxylicivirga marina]